MRDSDSQTPTGDQGSRRTFLKTAGTALGGMSLAGCLGDGQQDDGGGGGNGATTGTPSAQSLEIVWADNNFVQMGDWAVSTIKDALRGWEEKTGNTVTLETQTVKELQTQFKNQNLPHMVTSQSSFMGKFALEGLIRPLGEYIDSFPAISSSDDSKGFLDGMEFASEVMWHGYDNVWAFNFMMEFRNGFLGNMDHFEQTPGLSKEEDFPPKNLDHLIEIAKKLDKDGPGDVGFQMVAKQGDFYENMLSLLWAQDTVFDGDWAGQGGNLINPKNWSKSQANNETHRSTLTKYFDIWKKHDIGAPNTLQINHEATVPMMLGEQVSLSMQPFDSHSVYLNRGGTGMFTPEGPLKWGKFWSGPSKSSNISIMMPVALPTAPPDAEQSQWHKVQSEGVTDLINYMMSTEVMTKTLPTKASIFPTYKQPFNNIVENERTTAGTWLETCYKQFNENGGLNTSPAHPEAYTAKIDKVPKHWHESLKGNISTQKALKQADEELQSYLNSRQHVWDEGSS